MNSKTRLLIFTNPISFAELGITDTTRTIENLCEQQPLLCFCREQLLFKTDLELSDVLLVFDEYYRFTPEEYVYITSGIHNVYILHHRIPVDEQIEELSNALKTHLNGKLPFVQKSRHDLNTVIYKVFVALLLNTDLTYDKRLKKVKEILGFDSEMAKVFQLIKQLRDKDFTVDIPKKLIENNELYDKLEELEALANSNSPNYEDAVDDIQRLITKILKNS